MHRTLLATAVGLITAGPAFAHPGPHSGSDLIDAAAHVLRAPDHLAVILSLIAIAAVAAGLSRLARAKSAAKRGRS